MADHSRMPEQFKKYWLHGEGAAKIEWGHPGDFARCIIAVQDEITKDGGKPLPDRVIKGLSARTSTTKPPDSAPATPPPSRIPMAELDPDQVTVKMRHAVETALGGEMVTRFVVIAETIDENGVRALWTQAADGQKAWDTLGLLRFAEHQELAAEVRTQIQGD